MNEINQRLEKLREVMRREHLSAFIFPSTDAHQSEYVADHWQGRAWISGFNGSAGTAVVTMRSAALWTDSRYFIAAEEQLRGTEFQLMKLKVEGTPTISDWIASELLQNEDECREVGLDGMVNSYNDTMALISDLRKAGGITVRTNFDPLEQIWMNRPAIPENPVEIQSLNFAGETVDDKIQRIRKALREHHADGILVSALDDIAWTLNLRGTDVHCNPVFVSYLLISSEQVSLFVNPKKISSEVKVYLDEHGISLFDYNQVEEGLESYADYNILLDGDETSFCLWKSVKCQEIIAAKSPIPVMKAVKNATEIEGYHRAMLRDGVAMVKFLKWLKPAVEAGGQTEMSIDKKLTLLRAEQNLFRDISFDTIAGYQAHGAIVHYEATPETDAPLLPEGLILIDSGAQYQDGTTDITRTIALGPVTEEMKHIYTLVLKGHIQLELAKFPDGASGTQIDALSRECMWREGYNFLHGTGHGVGSYLNVHEGPHQIRMEWKPTPLRAGMTVTDEPGLYLKGKFGVRIENTLLIKDFVETAFGKFLQMESLTLCPIDTAPIDVDMLLPEEVEWLNAYHREVFEKLSPYLGDEEVEWLAEATKPLVK
ncbi:MAG: aminopeptidase P family protein [Prevotella sp.]|nr:aminopeptidase P family protein [Prevotella sp.]HRM57174.1 aminopeptidase P family protein [Prevotella sp.]